MSIVAAIGPGSRRWFAVQTRASSEDIALRHLANQNFTAFCPRARVNRKVGRHRVERLDPFFRGYVFVRLDLERERWRSVNGTLGVARLVTFDRVRPAPLPVGLVEQLQDLCSEGDELGFADDLSVGDAVRVMTGPFAELVGTLEAASGPERVTILLDVLARSTRVELPRALVARAD
jgi:transcriptional antiterminator RfaH